MKNQAELETVSEVLFAPRVSTIEINIETLSQSATHLMVGGNLPTSRPIHHYQFVTWLQQEFEDAMGSEAIVEPIHVSARHAKRIRISPDEIILPKDPCPIERLNIDRLVTRIYSPNKTNLNGEDVCPSLAVSYNDRGIEVAYGANVWVCANMNIFGGKRWSTYGTNKVSFEDLKTLLQAEMQRWSDSFNQDCEIITGLQGKVIELEDQRQSVAQLFEVAVQNNLRKKKDWILNISQTVKLQEELIKKRENFNRDLTWWDFTQAGTENLKPDRQDMISLYPTIENFNQWVVNEVCL
jgi:hypothetical protein